ncbi:hypothetical protein JCM8547_008753 [Rhodosporidiobolus lusitaniae]
MASERNKLVISPHAEGIARLTFSPDGRYLYTCGNEGYIRIIVADLDGEQTEPLMIDYHQEAVVSLAASNDYLCSASESGYVVFHKAGTIDYEGNLTRFSLPARSVRFDAKGKRAVVTSDEILAKVIDVKDPSNVRLLTGHSHSVREASWSPDGQIVTTSSTDGQIRVWQLDGTEPTCVQVIDRLIKQEDSDSQYSTEVIWHPSSKWFVVIGKDNEIAIVSRESWQKTGTFSAKDGHSERISALAFSVNGLYLASAGDKGEVLVWSVKERNIVSRTTQTHGTITGLAFHPAPTANSLAYIDDKGQLTRWQNPVPSNLPPPTFCRASAAATSANGTSKSTTRPRSDSASTSTSSRPGGNLFRKDGGDDEDEYGNLDDLDLDGIDGLDGWIDDDIGEGALDGEKGEDDPFADDIPLKSARGERELSFLAGGGGRQRRSNGTSGGYSSSAVVQKGQAPFQPGATPWREKRRYLAFNMIGYIFAVEREEGQSVTVEFHDRSAHIPMKFDDPMKYNLGALGELGAVFSCPSLNELPSKLYHKPYESWTSLQEWDASLPAGEDATVLAIGGMGPPPSSLGMDDPSVGLAGSGTVLVGTSRGFVRFFSGAGLQKYVWNVGEEIVAMAAGKDMALVMHRANGGVGPGLEYALIDTDTFEVVQEGRVPLPSKTTLRWIGFTDDSIPVMYDSNGLISILDRSRRPRQGRWLPALDSKSLARREGKQESYWPVGVTEQQAHVVILKGGETHPHFPTPLLQELDLQFPLLNLDVPQGQLEEKYLRESLFVSHRKDGAPADDYTLKSALAREELAADKHLLQIIQTFCKADRLEAALDAVLLLSQSASLNAAVKIAAFFDLPALKERIELIQQAKEDEADPDAAAARRQSKWAHLSDERYIAAAPAENGFGAVGSSQRGSAHLFLASANARDMFSPRPSGSPAFGSARKYSNGGGTPANGSSSSKKRKSFAEQQQPENDDLEVQQQQGDEDDDKYVVEQDGQEELPASSPKRMRVDSDEPLEEEEAAPPPPKKALNPFAKRAGPAKPASSPAANPFADKKAGKARDLGKTESFFNRVEGKEPPKAKGKGARALTASASSAKKQQTLPSSRQTTLFGMAPGVPKEVEKQSKKRKSVVGDDEAAAATIASTSTTSSSTADVSASTYKKLEAFRKRPGTAASSGLGAGEGKELPREGEEMEETQVEESQEETQPPAGKRQRRPSELEMLEEDREAEEGEPQVEDTQMDETQVEETQDESSFKENTRSSSAAPSSTSTKLAQFAFKKPELTVEVEGDGEETA